jgi:hypothetical protein
MKNPRLRRKKSESEPKLPPELRPELLNAMMQALIICEMGDRAKVRRLEGVERECVRLAGRSTGAVEALCRLTAKLARQYIESLQMAADSADKICKCLGRMAQ